MSALALWWPDEVGEPGSIQGAGGAGYETVGQFERSAASSAAPGLAALAAVATLPERLAAVTLDAARFDPFVGAVPPPAPVAPPTPTKAIVAAPEPEVQAHAPALNYRYLGQMTDPSGVQWVYLANNELALPVAVGTRLPEGYVVEALGPEGVRLHYPPLDAHAVIPVPAAQDPATR